MNMHTPVPAEGFDAKLTRRLDLEDAIGNLKGDALLLELALANVERGIDRAAKTHTIILNEDQLEALDHAVSRIFHGSREVSRLFHAEDAA